MPLISIITVCYNAAGTVERTLDSVDAQTFGNYEHLIIDGASTDGTIAAIKSRPNMRCKVVSEPDGGLYDAMNKGLALAKGDYVVYMNAGDKFHARDSLKTIADAIAANGRPGIVYGQTVLVDNDGNVTGERHLRAPANLTLRSFASGMVVCHQAFVVLRLLAPFYDLRYKYSADYDWCIQCLQHSRQNIGLGDTVLVDYLNEGLTTNRHKASLLERFRIMCTYYGSVPTVLRHIGFACRYALRKLKNKNSKQ